MGSLLLFKVVDVPNTDPGGTSKKAKIRSVCLTVLGIDLCNFSGALQPYASCMNGYEETRFWCKFARFQHMNTAAHSACVYYQSRSSPCRCH